MILYRCIKNIKQYLVQYSDFANQKPPWNILFFGSDEFSLYSLKKLHVEYLKGSLLNNLEIVTTLKKQANPVQTFAIENSLVIHNWPYLGYSNKYHVGIVVSFGHLLPEELINTFLYGILNVHGSLLPRWRGAAPIIHAIANGDTETGVTLMRIKPKHFDIGDIVMQDRVKIHPNMRMPELYGVLGEMGATCLISSLKQLPELLERAKPQSDVEVTFAPKITSQFAIINWQTMTSQHVLNLDRAISGILLPTCFWKKTPVKLIEIETCESIILKNNNEFLKPGYVEYHKPSKKLRILCANDTGISVSRVGVFGKKSMSATDFYNGFITKVPKSCTYFT